MRLPSHTASYQCDGTLHIRRKRLSSNGLWTPLVFPGDLSQLEKVVTPAKFADDVTEISHLAHLQHNEIAKMHSPSIHVLIHSSSLYTANLLDLPVIFHSFNDVIGWDH